MRNTTEKQLVREFSALGRAAQGIRTPRRGWVRQIRDLLHMPARVLADRCGLDRSTVTRLEHSESKRSITLRSLERLAEGLNCEVRYMLVPREPLDDLLMRQARAVARKEIAKVAHTMSLESQEVTRDQLELQIQDLAEELVERRSPRIWDDP